MLATEDLEDGVSCLFINVIKEEEFALLPVCQVLHHLIELFPAPYGSSSGASPPLSHPPHCDDVGNSCPLHVLNDGRESAHLPVVHATAEAMFDLPSAADMSTVLEDKYSKDEELFQALHPLADTPDLLINCLPTGPDGRK